MESRQPTFIDVLKRPENDKQLTENLNADFDVAGLLTRIFNNLPTNPETLENLTKSFLAAFKNDEIAIWYNLLIANISVDLLDENGMVRKEIIDRLDRIQDKRKREEVKQLSKYDLTEHIITSYFLECIFAAMSIQVALHLNSEQSAFGDKAKNLALDAKDYFETELRQSQKIINPTKINLDDRKEIEEKLNMIYDYLKHPDNITIINIFAFYTRREIEFQIHTLLQRNNPQKYISSLLSVHTVLDKYRNSSEASPLLSDQINAYFNRRTHSLSESLTSSLKSSSSLSQQKTDAILFERLTEMEFNHQQIALASQKNKEHKHRQTSPKTNQLFDLSSQKIKPDDPADIACVNTLRDELIKYIEIYQKRMTEHLPKNKKIDEFLGEKAILLLKMNEVDAKKYPGFSKFLAKYAVCWQLMERLNEKLPAATILKHFTLELNDDRRSNIAGEPLNYKQVLMMPENAPLSRKPSNNPSFYSPTDSSPDIKRKSYTGEQLLKDIETITTAPRVESPAPNK